MTYVFRLEKMLTSKNTSLDPWPSEERMSTLLTKLPNNTTLINQSGLEHKLKFWRERLENSLQVNRQVSFTVEQITTQEKFNLLYKGKKPPHETILHRILGLDENSAGWNGK